VHRLVLVLRLHDGGGQPLGARPPDDPPHRRAHDDREHREPRAVQREQQQPEQDRQQRGGHVQQQLLHPLLDGHRLEQPVHLLGQVGLQRDAVAHARHPEGEFQRHAREHPLLDPLDHAQDPHLERPRHHRPQDHQRDQQDDRLQEQPPLHELHDAAHRQREDEAQPPGQRGIEEHGEDFAPLPGDQRQRAFH
ncbi:MAG: hypothetical protein ACK56I_16390, partial [bacterium]